MAPCVPILCPKVDGFSLAPLRNMRSVQIPLGAIVHLSSVCNSPCCCGRQRPVGPLLYVYSRDEESEAQIKDDFSLLIADAASQIVLQAIVTGKLQRLLCPLSTGDLA
jgi:hypothetical protein